MPVLLVTDSLPADDRAKNLRAKSIATIQQAIAQFPISAESQVSIVHADKAIVLQPEDVLCPLTLHLPDRLVWDGGAIYQACRDVEGLRDRVQQTFNIPAVSGNFWLPIVLTAKGPLYAEVICREDVQYHQPFHLPDFHRQPLYRLAARLLRELNAPPSVYLLQFDWTDGNIGFDRLFPFPAEPAIASLNIQTPDLFTCYWKCLTRQPILDLQIPGDAAYRSLLPRK